MEEEEVPCFLDLLKTNLNDLSPLPSGTINGRNLTNFATHDLQTLLKTTTSMPKTGERIRSFFNMLLQPLSFTIFQIRSHTFRNVIDRNSGPKRGTCILLLVRVSALYFDYQVFGLFIASISSQEDILESIP